MANTANEWASPSLFYVVDITARSVHHGVSEEIVMKSMQEHNWSTWIKGALIHLVVVVTSLVLSLLVVPLVVPLDPKGTGATLSAMIVVAAHLAAVIVGLFFAKASALSCLLVFLISFSFTGSLFVKSSGQNSHLENQAPFDRFRENIESPIPKSVTNLRFVAPEDAITPFLMLRFDIDPIDFNAIVSKLHLEEVDPDKMLNPTDYFRHSYYMPVPGPIHIFQGKDRFDDIVTYKTNDSHSTVIFRKESSGYYRDRVWETENPDVIRIRQDALERLRLNSAN